MNLRAVAASAAAGCGLAAAAWLLIGAQMPLTVTLQDLKTLVAGASPQREEITPAARHKWPSPFAKPSNDPLVLQLEGVSRSARRTAALIMINGQPAVWMGLGETKDGFTLSAVQAGQVVVETREGAMPVPLGQSVDLRGPPTQSVADDSPPPGFHGPPEPASAPISP